MEPGSLEDHVPLSARLFGEPTARRSLAEELQSPDPTTSSTTTQNPPFSRWSRPDSMPSRVSLPDTTPPVVPAPPIRRDEIDLLSSPTVPSVWSRVAGAGTRLMSSMGPERLASPLSLSIIICTMMTTAQLAPAFAHSQVLGPEHFPTLFQASSKQ